MLDLSSKNWTWKEFILLWAAILFACVLWTPWKPFFPEPGEGVYGFVLATALERSWVFGKDIVFTYGPLLTHFGTIYYGKSQHLLQLGLNIFAFGTFAASFCRLSQRQPWITRVVLICLLFLHFLITWDSIFFFFPFLLVLDHVSAIPSVSRSPYGLRLCLLAGCILGLLYKGTVAIETIVILFLLDAYLIVVHRRPSFYLLALFAGSFFGLLSLGQPPTALFHLVRGYQWMVAGFSEALQMEGPLEQILVYLASFFLLSRLLVLLVAKDFKASLLCTACLALMGFVYLKAGFVRHDEHAQQAFTFLGGISILVGCFWPKISRHAWLSPLLVPLSVITMNAPLSRHLPVEKDFALFITKIGMRFTEFQNALNADYWKNLNEEDQDQRARLKRELYVPHVEGSADFMYQDQTAFLVNHGNYRPRPMFLHYSVTSKALLALNQKFLESNRAPDYFLVSLPDDKYFAAAFHNEGPLWPTLWSEYEFERQDHLHSIFHRRKKPTPPRWKELLNQSYHPDEIIEIPAAPTGAVVWANIEVKRSWVGSLWHFLFKLNSPRLLATLTNGNQVETPLITEMASAGFLVSFAPNQPGDFSKLSLGRAQSNVASLKIRYPNYSFGRVYQPEFRVRFRTLAFPDWEAKRATD